MNQLPPDPNHSSGELLPVPSERRKGAAIPASYGEPQYGWGRDPWDEPDSTGLLEYWRIIRRRKGALILISAIGAVVGFMVTLPQTPIYQVKTSIEIMGLNQNFLNVRESSPVTESGTSSEVIDIQTQVRILQSTSLVDRVVEHVTAVTPQSSSDVTRLSAWRKALNLPGNEPLDARSEAITYAKKNFKVRAMVQTRIIEVTVDSMNPDVAANFANTLANQFIEQTVESRFKTTERTGEFLSRQIDAMRVRLEQSEDRLQQYANSAGLIFTDEKTNVSEQKLSQVQQALSDAVADRILKQSRWEIASDSAPEALSDVLKDTTLREYQAKLTELNSQLAELRQTYTDESLQVKRVLAQVAPVQAALSREKNDILKRIRNEYDEAQRREKLLEADYAAQRGVVTGEGEKAIHYNILKHEVDSSRQLYDSMFQQLQQASLSSALRASNIRVVDPAKVPEKPYKPDIPISTGLGTLSGLLMGGLFIIVWERADRSIQDPGETAVYVNLQELGIIPHDKNSARFRVRFAGSNHSTRNLARAPHRTELAMLQHIPSAVAQSFRATLVSILFAGKSGSSPSALVVTSANPGEGKSTVVSNLGIAVAEMNQKVLLIDADLHRPRLHEIFNLKNDMGLSDVLRSRESFTGLAESIIQKTDVPNLYVLTSGTSISTATSLLYSNRMPELLQKLRLEFETIFLDTPPMLQIPDARVLGRMVDSVILVVRAGKTTRDGINAASQRFSEDGIHVLGTVLNDWNPKNSPTGYYGYHGYYNGYSNRSSSKPPDTDESLPIQDRRL